MAESNPESPNVHAIPFPVDIPPGCVVTGIAVAVRVEREGMPGHGVFYGTKDLEPIDAIGLFEAAKLKVYADTTTIQRGGDR